MLVSERAYGRRDEQMSRQQLVRLLRQEQPQLVAALVAYAATADPALWQAVGERGQEFCREDSRYHLDYLRAALITDYPVIFLDYARWLRSLHENHAAPLAPVRLSLIALREVLEARAPTDSGLLQRFIGPALAVFPEPSAR